MATLDQLIRAAEAAEKAGNIDDVKLFLSEAKKLRDQQNKPKEKPKKAKATFSGGLRTLAQGITLGYGDEAEAYVRSKFSGSKDYDELLQEVRSNVAEFKKAKPVLGAGLEIGGAILPSIVPAGLAIRGGLGVARASGLGSTLARGGAVGAAEGAVAGFGVGEGGLQNRLGSAATGAAIGAPLGAVAPAAIGVAGRTASGALDALGLSGASRARTIAERRVNRELGREGLEPSQALNVLEEAQARGAPMMPVDIGVRTRGAGKIAQSVPNRLQTETAEALTERSAEQSGRIADKTAEMMQAEGRFGLDYLDDVYEEAQLKFKPLYDQAEKNIQSDPFRTFAERKVFKEAFKEIQDRADTLGEELVPDLSKVLQSDTVPTSYLQKIAQGLDRIINSNTSKIEGMNDKARDVLTVRNKFKELIGDQNKAYKAADKEFADMSDIKRAFDVGSRFDKLSEQDFVRKLRNMNETEFEGLKVGLITQVREMSSVSNDSIDFVKKLFGSPKKRNALREAFPTSESFDTFEKFMKDEASMVATNRRVLSGSDTFANIEENAEAAVDPASMVQLLLGGRGEALRQGANALGGRMRGVGGPVAEGMNQLLFARTPQAQREAMERLTQRQLSDVALRGKMQNRPEFYSGLLGSFAGLNSEDF